MPSGDTLITSLTLHQAKLIFLDVMQPFIEAFFAVIALFILWLAYRIIIYPWFRSRL